MSFIVYHLQRVIDGWVRLMVSWNLLCQTVVKRGIEMGHATAALIQLIKDNGRWVDPPAEG
jgi:hypothetical protein